MRLNTEDGTGLDKLLEKGCVAGGIGWLEISSLDGGALPTPIDLSALVQLMPVVVGREGAAGPGLKMGPNVVVGNLSVPLLDAPETTPTPTTTPTATPTRSRRP